MDRSRICKICNRSFANGKAIGGHMRSHLAKLPLPPKPITVTAPPQSLPKSPSSSSSTSSSSLNHLYTKNPMQSYRSLNRDFNSLPKPTLYDGDSETESQKNPTRKRSIRCRKLAEQVAVSVVNKAAESSKQVSSNSDFCTEEDAAMCLLMLSKDTWTRDPKKEVMVDNDMELEQEEVEFVDAGANAEDDGDELYSLRSGPGKFKCETCKKTFPSYQALGGHRASHKKIKLNVEEGSSRADVAVLTDQRTFKCPFCEKVFESGQALGGHKKVHFSYFGKAKASSSNGVFDLNQPASDQEVGEVSQVKS